MANNESVPQLNKPREEVKEVIAQRIKEGKELLANKKFKHVGELEDAFKKWDSFNEEYLKQIFNTDYNRHIESYESSGAWDFLKDRNSTRLVDVQRMIKTKILNFESFFEKIDIIETTSDSEIHQEVKTNIDMKSIFIVHGHDASSKNEVARFIEKIGFNPIILHEQASSGRTIIEKIENYTNVGFGIVLYTSCDLGGINSTAPKLQNRARQNVVFEHGYLIAKLGRSKVCALVKGEIETPGDISGVVYISLDEGGGWKLGLAKELKNAGYEFNTELILN